MAFRCGPHQNLGSFQSSRHIIILVDARDNLDAQLGPDGTSMAAFIYGIADGRECVDIKVDELHALVWNCSKPKIQWLLRKLERFGLVGLTEQRERRKLLGWQVTILQKPVGVTPATLRRGEKFHIPRRAKKEPLWLFTDPCALVGTLPRKESVLRFPRNERCALTWHITHADKTPAVDCEVHASLYHGRSQNFPDQVCGKAVSGFRDLPLQHQGDGDYSVTVRLNTAVICDSNYIMLIRAERAGRRFGWWEIPTEIFVPDEHNAPT